MTSWTCCCFLLLALISCTQCIHMGVKNEGPDGKYCIVMDADISGVVEYFDTKLGKTVDYPFVVNGTGWNVEGKCFDETVANQSVQILKLHFFPNGVIPSKTISSPERWTIKIEFQSQTDPYTYTFKILKYQLKAIFYPDIFNASAPDNNTITYTAAPDAELEWAAKDKLAFACSSSSLKLVNNSHIDFAQLKVLAFAIQKNDQFVPEQRYEMCPLDLRTSGLVPIIVGALLAGLVIIVLVAYLIGRARAKRQGYASV